MGKRARRLAALDHASAIAPSQPTAVVAGLTYASFGLLAVDVVLRLAPHGLSARHLSQPSLLARVLFLIVTAWIALAAFALDLTPRTERVMKLLAICYVLVMVVLILNRSPRRY